MQNLTAAERGIQLTGLFSAFSMFFVIKDPVKFSWIILLSGSSMLYFSIQKYKTDKKAGKSIDKARSIIIMASTSVAIMAACFIASFYM